MAETSSQQVSGTRFTRGDWAAVAVLLLLLLFLFRIPLFTDDILLSFDSRYWPPYSVKATPEVYNARANMIHADLPMWLMPERLVTTRMAEEGVPPYWTPYTLGGMPLFAGLAYPVCYPVIGVLNGVLGMDPLQSMAWQSLIHLVAAGLGMYLFLRALALCRLACLLGALSLSASAWYLTHLYIPLFVNAGAWIPLMFWAGERMVCHRPFGRYGLITTGLVGMSALGGFPQITLIGLYGVGLWVFVRALFRKCDTRARLRPVIAFALASAIGFALSAVPTLAALELKNNSMRDADYPLEYYKAHALEGPALLGQVVPGLFGHPVDPEGGGGFHGNKENFLPFRLFLTENVQNNFMENALYIGIIPLLLALAALGQIRRSPVKILVLLMLIALLIAMGTPLTDAVYHGLPGFKVGHPKRVLVLHAFALSALAAFGLHRFISCREKKPGWIITAGLLATGIAGLSALTFGFSSLSSGIERCWSARSDQPIPAEELASVLDYLQKIAWPAVVALLLFAGTRLLAGFRIPRAAIAILLLGYTLFELSLFGSGFLTFQPGESQYPSTKTTDFLEGKSKSEHPFRVIGFGAREVLLPNLTAVHGIQCAGGVSGLLVRRYGEYCHALDPALVDMDDARWVGALEEPRSLDSPLLDLLGIRYVAVHTEEHGRLLLDKGFTQAFRDDPERMGLFENPEALPRAFAVTDCRILPGEEVLECLRAPEFDPGREVILEEALPAGFTPAPDPEGMVPEVEIQSYTPLEIEVTADMKQACGFLVLTDTYYPGWQAVVDGNPAPILAADHAFRAIPLNEGRHIVRFSYQPATRTQGLAITWIALGAVVIWIVLQYRDR